VTTTGVDLTTGVVVRVGVATVVFLTTVVLALTTGVDLTDVAAGLVPDTIFFVEVPVDAVTFFVVGAGVADVGLDVPVIGGVTAVWFVGVVASTGARAAALCAFKVKTEIIDMNAVADIPVASMRAAFAGCGLRGNNLVIARLVFIII